MVVDGTALAWSCLGPCDRWSRDSCRWPIDRMRKSVSAGSVGVSLINVISSTSYVSAIVVLWTSTEASIGAISEGSVIE